MAIQTQNTNLDLSGFAPSVRDAVMDRLSSVDMCAFHSSDYAVIPGFCDVHVHFREPGFSYKETILTGSLAAAHGGYTAVCTMPNLNPVPDSKAALKEQLDIKIDKKKIELKNAIKNEGEFTAKVRLFAGVAADLKVIVTIA